MDVGFCVDVGNAVSSFVLMSGGCNVEGRNSSSSESLGRMYHAFGTGRRQREGAWRWKKGGKWENWSEWRRGGKNKHNREWGEKGKKESDEKEEMNRKKREKRGVGTSVFSPALLISLLVHQGVERLLLCSVAAVLW